MKTNYGATIILLSIFLLAALPKVAAHYIPINYAIRRGPHHHHWRRGPNNIWDSHDTTHGEYICDVAKASPLKSDVEDVAGDLSAQPKRDICSWNPQDECTTVAVQGSAGVELCNIWNGGMPCRAIGKIVSRITAKCAHRFWGEAEPRVSGKAVFDWGTIVVS